MRHRYKTLKTLKTGVQKRQNVVRNLLTSLVKYWQIKTTEKKAKVLKAQVDSLFNKVIAYKEKYDDKAFKSIVEKLADEYLTADAEAKSRFLMEYIPKIVNSNKKTGFVYNYKFVARKWDNVLQVVVGLDLDSHIEKEERSENKEEKPSKIEKSETKKKTTKSTRKTTSSSKDKK